MSTTEPGTVAVVGCGYWGKNLVRNFAELGALRAVVEPTDSGRALAADLAPTARMCSSLTEVLGSEIDGVVLATPAETHHEIAVQCLRAGKHVLVEKPLALTYTEGKDLVEVAAEERRILMVGHVLEYHPGIVALTKLVRDGVLGELQYVYSNRLSLGKVRREENILWSFAPHDIAVILRLIGAMPIEVLACGGAYVQPSIADVTVTQLLFDGGVRAHIHVSWLHPFKEQRLVVIGSQKMATFDDVAKELMLHDQRVDMRGDMPVPIKGEGETVPYCRDEPLRLECLAFLEAMATGVPPLTDGVSGLRVLEVLNAAQHSLMHNGELVRLPPASISPRLERRRDG
ncbi:MAG: Gfo/Idh/MocA family oxidoreductase [Thermomicrobiales bacterium]|nr:Gfo/Idh/MocA family oxidoreductase [Thermomicrobiales bacterium]